MVIPDLIVDAFLPGPDRSRKPRKLFRKGQPAAAQIIGINYEEYRLTGTAEDSTSFEQVTELALYVQGDSPFVCGVEQRFDNQARLRLGQTVQVRIKKEKAVLAPDVGAGLRAQDPRWFCKPPAEGITDSTLWDHVMSRNRDLPATITFTEALADSRITTIKVAATALVQGPGFEDFIAQTGDVKLRPYSSHLETLNYPLPGWARPGKKNEFVVDWASAANHNPGLGAPPGYFRELIGAAGSMDPLANAPADSWSGQGLIDAANQSQGIGGVSFEAWATALAHCKLDKIRIGQQDDHVQQFGIAPGTWRDLSSHWSTEMRTNPRLAIAMRAIEKQVKKDRKQRR